MKKILSVLISWSMLCLTISFGQVNVVAADKNALIYPIPNLPTVSTAVNNIFMKIQPRRHTTVLNSYLLIYKGESNPLCRAAQSDIGALSLGNIADNGVKQPGVIIPPSESIPKVTAPQSVTQAPTAPIPAPTIRQTVPQKTIPDNTQNTKSAAPKPTEPKTSGQNTTQPPVSTGEYSAYQKKVVELVNKERAAAGVSALSESAQLDPIATLKSQDMVDKNYFDHQSPTYGSPFEMLKSFGIRYSFAGENIAYGQSTPEEVMKGWMNSSGHRANILNTNYTQIGVGVAKKSNGQLVWTQTFVRP